MQRIILVVIVTLLGPVAAMAPAQPQPAVKPGDYIIACWTPSGDVVYAVTPWTNTSRTLLTLPTSNQIRGVTGGPLNKDYYVASGLNVFKVTMNNGTVTTVATIATLSPGVNTTWADLDEDGNILVGTGWRRAGALFSVDYQSGLWKVISQTGFIFPNAFVLDRDTGDIVYGDCPKTVLSTTIYRLKRGGKTVKVLTFQGPNYSMDFHPQSGDVLIGTSNSSILKLDAANTLSTWATGTGLVKSLAVQADGNVAAGPLDGNTIHLYDSTGTMIGTPYNGARILTNDMVIADEHNVWGANAMVIGTNFSISIRFAAHSGKPYLMAAAFTRRPGISIGGRVIPLNPDVLFFTSMMVPTTFNGFRGTLDASGSANAFIVVPRIPALRGHRVFLAAVVIDPKAPSGIGQISQAYGVTVQ